jgi:O-antigen/teichoic acid export membrane protein
MHNDLGRNSFWLLLARLSAHGFAILFIVLAARRLGVDTFGQFTVIASLVIVANTFTTFGTETLLIREIAKAGHVTSLAARVLGLQLGLSAFWWLATLVVRPDPPLLIYTLSLFPLAVVSVTSALLRAFERMRVYWLLSFINGIVQAMAALFSADLWSLCVLVLCGQMAMACVALWVCRLSLPPIDVFPSMNFKPLFGVIWPFAAMTTLSVFSQRLGILSIAIIEGDQATGLFSSAVRLVEGLKFGHYAVLGALLPALARDAARSRRGFKVSLLILLATSILLAVGVNLLAQPIMALLFGQAYIPAAGLLSILGWSLIPYTISAFISVDLVTNGRELDLLKAMLLSLLVFVVLYIYLISEYGLSGAAWAAFAGEVFQAIILVRFVKTSNADLVSNLANTNEVI